MYKEIEHVNMKQAQSMQSINVLGPASNIKGEKHRLKQELIKNCKTRQHFFTNRIVEGWNSLPAEVVAVNTVNQFKSKLESIDIEGIVKKKKTKDTYFT